MKDLMTIQNQFQDYLLHDNDEIESAIVNTEKVSTAMRLLIYGNAYQLRLIEALESSYPVLKIFMGEDDFYQLSQDYLSAYPSTYRSIRWFGDQLPEFLKQHECYGNQLWLRELADIEWTMSLVFDAADSEVLIANDLIALPAECWESLEIEFVPSVYCLNLSWNVFPIWQALSDEQPVPELISSPTPRQWVLWRDELLNQYVSQPEEEALVFNKMKSGANFTMMCESLCEWMDEEQAVIRGSTLLRTWVDAGMIKKFKST